jgi:hypothetical protein
MIIFFLDWVDRLENPTTTNFYVMGLQGDGPAAQDKLIGCRVSANMTHKGNALPDEGEDG